MTYVFKTKSFRNSEEVVIDSATNPEAVKKFFAIIERETGLDRVMAETILQKLGSIEHPQFEFLLRKG